MSEGPSAGQDSRREEDPAGGGDPAVGRCPAEGQDPAGERDPALGQDPAGGREADRDGPAGGPRPQGDAYAWYQRGLELLGNHSPAAAAQLLERAADAEPQSRMVREALARAQFDAGWYPLAVQSFRRIVEESPADDYAHFGLGLALARSGDPRHAAEYLALAAAMRPDLPHYSAALRDVRATLRAAGRSGEPGAERAGS